MIETKEIQYDENGEVEAWAYESSEREFVNNIIEQEKIYLIYHIKKHIILGAYKNKEQAIKYMNNTKDVVVTEIKVFL